MKKTNALWALTAVIGLLPLVSTRGASPKPQPPAAQVPAAAQQAAPKKQPQWSGRDEYDAFNAMTSEKDPNKRISLAEAFVQKYPNSDFKDQAYQAEMAAYAQLNAVPKAIEAAGKVLAANPDNLDALVYLSYVFPFVFKPTDPSSAQELANGDAEARHGLELLQTLQKPASVTEEQFAAYVKPKRAVFNNAIGFAALQRKDYPAAITAFQTAEQDNPSDFYTFYRLGLAYLYSTPPDYDHAVWDIARAADLANAAHDPAGAEIGKFLRRAYVNYHGNEEGLSDILTQAATSPTPPEGFKVKAMETPKHTGNPNIDGFNTMAFPLKLGGEKAQKQWDALRGQPIELGGFVAGVEKGQGDADVVRISVDQAKAAEGTYDIALNDATQPNVKNLAKGDPVMFKGTLAAYETTPNLVLSVNGEITTPLPEAKAKPKPTKKAPVRRAARKTQG